LGMYWYAIFAVLGAAAVVGADRVLKQRKVGVASAARAPGRDSKLDGSVFSFESDE
jgi:hypothetical protein